jgi:hypothetical protein
MNLYRVGQNGVVVATLMNIGKMNNTLVFVMCVAMLLFATLCQHNLIQVTTGSKSSQAEALNEINEIGEENDKSDEAIGDAGNNDADKPQAVDDIEAPSSSTDAAATAAQVADSKGD